MGYQEPVFDVPPTDPEPTSWQSKSAAKRRKKEAEQLNEGEENNNDR